VYRRTARQSVSVWMALLSVLIVLMKAVAAAAIRVTLAGWLAGELLSAARRVLCEKQQAGRYTLARTDLLAAHSGQPDVPLQAVDMASRWRPAHQRTDRDRNGECARALFLCR
jgi:hypothetical protein